MIQSASKPSSSAGLGGHPALDFLNTTHGPGKPDELEAANGLAAWMASAGLLGPADIASLAKMPPSAFTRAEREARRLRAVVRLCLEHGGPQGHGAALAACPELDRALDRDDSRVKLQSGEGGAHALRVRRWRTPGPMLAVLAESVADLVAAAPAGRVKRCASPDCVILFLDRTRTGTRRWCSMDLCGNRAKVRDLRARRALP
jgi:predicted RNA-binding Zn ribbon-like protein